MTKRVAIVGAGIAGLACAVDLAARGLDVTVLERAAAPGGKMREIVIDERPIDSGPTVFTMRWIFDALFEAAGTSLDAELKLAPLEVLARHAWSENERLDLFVNVARSAEAIGDFAGRAEARRFLTFCDEAQRVYRALEGPYIRAQRPSLAGMGARLGLRGLATLSGIGPFSTLWQALGRHFTDPRLRQLFGRYATYCGASPFAAPATLMLIAHVELAGVWSVAGGMHQLARALERVAVRHGARFRYASECKEIAFEGGRARGVVLASGERIDADAVVFNGDVNALASGLLGAGASAAASRVPAGARSLSALTMSMLAPTTGFALAHHNVFFGNDYAGEFRDIFERGTLPRAPTVYICAPDRTEVSGRPALMGISNSLAPNAVAPAERLFFIINAPATGDQRAFDTQELEQCRLNVRELLTRCGLHVHADPAHTVVTTPDAFERLFPATGGALYGRATHGWMSAFTRPSAVSRIPGLYLAGGSVHPGAGVPMAAMSGRLAAEAVLRGKH
jgi:1-hydroxycarotenoid 3,4-desaturase